MAEETQQQPTFPRRGTEYTPLPRGKKDGRVQAHAVQTIRATPEQVYQVYTRAELLPAWQEGVISVKQTGDRTHHWVMQDPGSGKQIEFDAEVLEDTPSQRFVTRITDGPFEGTTDNVTFTQHPAGRGTVVTFVTDFKLPGGVITNALAAVGSRSPEQLTIENLRHLKELIESGEIPTVEGQPAGPRGIMGKWKRFLMGENLPTPPGTADRSRPRDEAEQQGHDQTALLLGTVAAVAGLGIFYGIRKAFK